MGDPGANAKPPRTGHPLRAAHQLEFVLLPAARPDDRELSTDGHPRPARVVFV